MNDAPASPGDAAVQGAKDTRLASGRVVPAAFAARPSASVPGTVVAFIALALGLLRRLWHRPCIDSCWDSRHLGGVGLKPKLEDST